MREQRYFDRENVREKKEVKTRKIESGPYVTIMEFKGETDDVDEAIEDYCYHYRLCHPMVFLKYLKKHNVVKIVERLV